MGVPALCHRFGSEVYRFIFAAKTRTVETDHAFREAIQTFRRLSLREIHATKPLRLKINQDAAGPTRWKRSPPRMALLDHQVERFRVLNGLDSNDRPKAGDSRQEIIVE